MRGRNDGGVTLVGWILLVVVAVTLLSLVIPACYRAKRHEKLVDCRGRLALLYKAQAAAPPSPSTTGSSYWIRLAKAPAALVDTRSLHCPFVPAEIVRDCDFLGPRADPAGLAGDDPLGCDMPENHDGHGGMGGNVLYKSGTVKTLHPGEPGTLSPWQEASQIKCGP